MTCQSGKRGYKSRRAAVRAHCHAGWRIRAYFCKLCRHWHVTHHIND